jgi:YfiH family protein
VFYWRTAVLDSDDDGRGPTLEAGFTHNPADGSRPFGRFNLGGHVGDDPHAVEANRERLAAAVGVPRDHLLFMDQVHGADVAVVDGPWPGPPPAVDALVTTRPGLALAVLVADCVPVLLHDVDAGVVAAVHAGRPGLLAGVVPATLAKMRSVGARRVSAVVGPSVCGRCYELPEHMVTTAARTSPSSVARSWTGTPAMDVAAGVVEQLAGEDVPVRWVPGCTREDPELSSYRRAPVTGRFAGVIVLKSPSDVPSGPGAAGDRA